mgnify:CR=1 FL=1
MTNFAIDSLFSVRGKVVVVTGGSRGIGEMIAAGFLANGATVYISSRKADACDATAARLAAEYGGTCVSLPANLAELDGIDSFATRFGEHESRLDVLVNNAGVSWGAPIEEFPEAGWDKVMDTNVKGVFFLTQRDIDHQLGYATQLRREIHRALVRSPADPNLVADHRGDDPGRFQDFAHGEGSVWIGHVLVEDVFKILDDRLVRRRG